MKKPILRFNYPVRRRERVQNMLLGSAVPSSFTSPLQGRGLSLTGAQDVLNPYYNNNFMGRWQEYVRWYMTAWEARKIIDIPVEDALRKPVDFEGLQPDDEKLLKEAYAAFGIDRKIRRALIQERLLGGALILPIFLRPENENTAAPLNYSTLQPGDLKGMNVIDISRLSRPAFDDDPFSPGYDKIETILVNGVEVHISRTCILDGDALFSRAGQSMLENFRFNPCGFGESKLAVLYELLNRVVGTQQGAYHLVNMASCLLIEADNLRSVIASDSPALNKLQEICEQLSLYRGAVIDAKGAKISQHAANFGSVPELVMIFAQLLSAASDIPATRFLGQAPGGLNASGESDQNNYYDMLESYQRLKLMPVQRKCCDWLGATLWGWEKWVEKSKDFELVYPDLKSMTEKEESEISTAYADIARSFVDSGIIGNTHAVSEMLKRKIFKTEVEALEFLQTTPAQAGNPLDSAS